MKSRRWALEKKGHVDDLSRSEDLENAGDREFSGTSLFRLANLTNIHQ